MKRLHQLVLVLILALLPTSCASTDDHGGEVWSDVVVEAPSLEVLWQVTKLAFQRENFPVQNRFDVATRTTVTGWETSLAPFKGDGYRERAEVRYEALGSGSYELEARVVRETNECLARPLDISYAKWRSAADNDARARILLQRIRAYLGDDDGFEVGTKPRPFE